MTSAKLDQLRGAIARHPARSAAFILGVQALVWTALPSLVFASLPLDGIEALIYGREWQLGSHKLPPLPWWIAELAFQLCPSNATLYALAQICVASALAIVWLMAREIVGPRGALAAVLIVLGAVFFQEASITFNHNLVELPFWALTGYALRAGLLHNRWRDWILLGISFGAGFWAKYFVVVLALPCAVFMVVDPRARAALRRPGPWLAIAIAAAIVLPHLVWLVQNEFLPLAYVEETAMLRRGAFDHIVHPAQFAGEELGYLLPALLVAAPLLLAARSGGSAADRAARGARLADFDFRIVTMLNFGPVLTVVALSALTGRGAVGLWGHPLWLFLGLWIVLYSQRDVGERRLTAMVGLWALVLAAFAGAMIGFNSGLFGLGYVGRSYNFPGARLAAEAVRRFHTATGRDPAYVIGPLLQAGNISRYAPNRPRVIVDGNFAHSPWIDPAAVRASGALLIWEPTADGRAPEPIAKLVDAATAQPPILVPVANGRFTFAFTWAILPPR